MIVSELFDQINAAYRGTDDDAPVSGSVDYTLWLNTTNRKINEWARDGKNTWQSLFDIREVGTVAFGTQTYDLDDQILVPADEVTITTLTDNILCYKISKPQERTRYIKSAYVSGIDPQKLTFPVTFPSTSDAIGGTINLAAYFIPDDLTASTDTILVDDPYWLVYAVASELAFNDLTYESKYVDLNTKANTLYAQMSSNNRRGSNDNPRQARTNVERIRGTDTYLREF